MRVDMVVQWPRILLAMLLLLLTTGLVAGYGLQLAETNEYMGYRAFPVDSTFAAALALSLLLTWLLLPGTIRKPSDFFALLFCLFVLVPYAALHQIQRPLSLTDFSLYFAVLAAPLIVIRVASLVVIRARFPALIGHRAMVAFIVIVCLVGVFLALSQSPASAGFDFVTSYDRRIEGRSIFSAGSPSAYLNAAIVNGLAPFLAFVGGWRAKPRLIVFALFCGVIFFYLLGLKAPILFIFLAAVIGYLSRSNKIRFFSVALSLFLVATVSAFIIEYYVLGFSQIGDYLIRRVFSVPPYLVSAYFDFMSSSVGGLWSPLEGVTGDTPVSFVVGEQFLGFPGLNANTNAFIAALAGGGIPGYVFTIFLVTVIFILLDAAYASKRSHALLYVGFSFSILLTEQAATTTLVSSGIGFIILLAICTSAGRPANLFTTLNRAEAAPLA